jgi:hypothetical protein
MALILDGTLGITTPSETNTGTLSVTGVTTLTGGLNAALPVLSGGTGVTTKTGTGAGVHADTPVFTTTIGVGAATPSASGSGITFPATQSASSDANTLDDYEEGTWTPVIRGSGTAGTYQQSITLATYTKVGRQVTLQCYILLAGVVTGGGTSYLQITGAPFTAFSPNQFPCTILLTDMAKSVTTLYVGVSWANTTTMYFPEIQPTAFADFPVANAIANKTIQFTMTYFV